MRNSEAEGEIVAELQRLGFEIVPDKYRLILHRVVGDQSIWLDLYYENGGSWLPDEGFYVRVVVGDLERDQYGRFDFVAPNAIVKDDCYLGRKLPFDEPLFLILDRYVSGVKQRRFEELRAAYGAYQKVAGLTWDEVTPIASDT